MAKFQAVAQIGPSKRKENDHLQKRPYLYAESRKYTALVTIQLDTVLQAAVLTAQVARDHIFTGSATGVRSIGTPETNKKSIVVYTKPGLSLRKIQNRQIPF